METLSFTLTGDKRSGWYVIVTNTIGSIVDQIATDAQTLKEAKLVLDRVEGAHKQEYALWWLSEVFPVGSTVTIVLKKINQHDCRYSVFGVYNGQIKWLDQYLEDAGICWYTSSKTQPNGVDFHSAGGLLTAISSSLYNRPDALRSQEIL